MSEYLDFMTKRLGANWVLARRTCRILARYGDDVNCVTPKQLRTAEREYRLAHGREYDEPRAAMYRALVLIESRAAPNQEACDKIRKLARLAIEQEQNTF